MEYKDYYAALGVPRTASQAEIKKAFRKLAREHHPDINKGAAAERRFKEINEANAVLGDPGKRKAYDALGADWEAYQRAGSGPGGAGAADPFAAFRQGRDGIRYEFRTASGEEAAGFSDFFRAFFSGAATGAQTATRAGRRTTTTSMGGMDFGDILGGLGLDEAGVVGGSGRPRTAPVARQHASADVEVGLEEAFAGTTRLVEVAGKRLEVTIPRGVKDGQSIRLSGKAGTGPDAGNVYLRIRVAPHPVFTRRGDDLHREVPISLEEALLGAEVPVETLKGNVLLRIPPETQNGRVFRLTGRGMPQFKTEGAGHLYVRIRVVLPTGLAEADRTRLRAFTTAIGQPDPRSAGPGRDRPPRPTAAQPTPGGARP